MVVKQLCDRKLLGKKHFACNFMLCANPVLFPDEYKTFILSSLLKCNIIITNSKNSILRQLVHNIYCTPSLLYVGWNWQWVSFHLQSLSRSTQILQNKEVTHWLLLFSGFVATMEMLQTQIKSNIFWTSCTSSQFWSNLVWDSLNKSLWWEALLATRWQYCISLQCMWKHKYAHSNPHRAGTGHSRAFM